MAHKYLDSTGLTYLWSKITSYVKVATQELKNLKALAFKDKVTGTITPSGTISGGAISVTLNTDVKYTAENSTGGGIVVAGSPAEYTLPSLITSVSDETLIISWSAGTFTANVPTAVTLPLFTKTTIANGTCTAEVSAEPAFIGTKATIELS